MRDYYVECQDCGHQYITTFHEEYGMLVAADSSAEECVECGSSGLEVGAEYVPLRIQSFH